ncbi:lytic murein transglycosylase [Pseudorhodoferax sp. Leaf274]|uniref:lytic murein transglycosylase n=1 Tax=Pseudorhodoferax sp. Leaf274 TaxID=1736318 RepID=UPI0007034342|nr:lytic murein transglycosylase [Pseudorhodoferax sp. Leaf274]KQP43282.1 murein transglycosylase [Pseudorhodoferax sp. Leaf274]
MLLTYRRRTLAPLLAALAMAGCATPPSSVPAAPASPAAPPTAPQAPPPSVAVQPPVSTQTQDFAQWIARFRAEARAAGITDATLHTAFDGVRHLDQVVALDRSQPEFTRSVWDYLDTAVSPTRVARGQDKLLEVRTFADAAAARYGVPAEIVVAIWGMESNYGSNYGDTPTIDALATLAFEGRRAAWARGQLMAALRILQNGDIARERMLGSWAGAMGQTQFLPSNFLAYAVDADGDGRRDIWGSMADVTASTAHFLAREGWQRGQPWGLEVRLPPGFDLSRADDALRQSSAQWAAEGVRAADGAALPDLPTLRDANLLLPAGARGPVFLVGPNFRAILRYNNATSYALGVALLAQRIAGGPAVQADWPRDLKPLSRNAMQALQQALQSRGFDPGTIDGVLGPATRGALRGWQRSVGLPADGFPTQELLDRLQQG